jgi:beta-glucanase (GH16 family)
MRFRRFTTAGSTALLLGTIALAPSPANAATATRTTTAKTTTAAKKTTTTAKTTTAKTTTAAKKTTTAKTTTAAKTTTTRTATAMATPSGQAMPTGDLTGWQQVFADDFTTDVPLGQFPSAVSTKWTAYADGWKDTSKNGRYSPSKVLSVGSGVLNMYLHTENGVHMVAAPQPKLNGPGRSGGLLYGRYAVRYKADPLPGYKAAWLLWPDSNDWTDGEIDFPEGNLDRKTYAFMHHRGTPTAQDAFATTAGFDAWHTAVTEWTPQSVKFYLDGVLVGSTANTAMIPNTPMHWVLQTETALNSVPADSAAGNVQVDWVAAYARK